MKTWVFAGAVAAFLLLSGAGAYAKHAPKQQRLKMRNMGQFGNNYMAPKKQKPPTGWYRNSLTGQMVFGTPPAPKPH
jgi:hypothetical protein